MHNKCSNKTELNCNAKQCFYEDYWKFMTRVHHDMTHNAWAMSIGELRTLKDEIIVLHNKAVDLVNANECYDEAKTKERKYFMWLYCFTIIFFKTARHIIRSKRFTVKN